MTLKLCALRAYIEKKVVVKHKTGRIAMQTSKSQPVEDLRGHKYRCCIGVDRLREGVKMTLKGKYVKLTQHGCFKPSFTRN